MSKWGFGIGFSKGICWTGKQLKQISEPLDIGAFFDWWYSPNSFQISCFYTYNDRLTLEFGLDYAWSTLTNRKGLESSLIPNVVDSIDGWLATSSKWDLKKVSLFLAVNKGGTFSYGGEITYAWASTTEAIWAPIIIDEADVRRQCIGGGIFFLAKLYYKRDKKINLVPVIGGRISFAYEYKNNSPWKASWKEQLKISFSGVYMGLQLVFGGV